MKIFISIFLVLAASVIYANPASRQPSPSDLLKSISMDKSSSPGDQLVKGLKLVLTMKKHDCKNGDCNHYTLNDGLIAMQAASYVHGFIQGVRARQIAEDAPKVVNFPEGGFDSDELIQPLIEFLEKNPALRQQDNSISVYIFLKRWYDKNKKTEQ
jgi:hypothetical protein